MTYGPVKSLRKAMEEDMKRKRIESKVKKLTQALQQVEADMWRVFILLQVSGGALSFVSAFNDVPPDAEACSDGVWRWKDDMWFVELRGGDQIYNVKEITLAMGERIERDEQWQSAANCGFRKQRK